jgi:hypothetical protein
VVRVKNACNVVFRILFHLFWRFSAWGVQKHHKTFSKNDQGTDFPSFFFFFFLGAPCVGFGPSVDMPPHVGTRSWLWGLPFELVPSDDPFMWCFYQRTFFPTDIFFSSEQEIKFVTSTTTAAVQSKSNSHVTVYYPAIRVAIIHCGHHVSAFVCPTQVACQLTDFAVVISSALDHLASPSKLSLYPSQQKVRSATVSVSRTKR